MDGSKKHWLVKQEIAVYLNLIVILKKTLKRIYCHPNSKWSFYVIFKRILIYF